jgi:hypothetical protein
VLSRLVLNSRTEASNPQQKVSYSFNKYLLCTFHVLIVVLGRGILLKKKADYNCFVLKLYYSG